MADSGAPPDRDCLDSYHWQRRSRPWAQHRSLSIPDHPLDGYKWSTPPRLALRMPKLRERDSGHGGRGWGFPRRGGGVSPLMDSPFPLRTFVPFHRSVSEPAAVPVAQKPKLRQVCSDSQQAAGQVVPEQGSMGRQSLDTEQCIVGCESPQSTVEQVCSDPERRHSLQDLLSNMSKRMSRILRPKENCGPEAGGDGRIREGVESRSRRSSYI